MKMNNKFYRKVADYIPVPLPKPTMKQNKPLLDEDGNEIPIITVTCEGIEW